MQRFTQEEHSALLGIKGVGPKVIARLEAVGISSLMDLAQRDPQAICAMAAIDAGSTCWRNSPMALRAITAAVEFAQAARQN
ncbi:helix-hairpin-helix domain-containing protein [Novosphingobium umbonatum]|uniref:Helix-hairpin-helix domain-containing protein n=1 Tax=Novosphingobium umbonatum TaxID=1908524 RepID=A0A437MWV0_9SPHN|nr:helix-hairpin-helix domain-containing protein [Novosphingobium umbonatum]